MKQENRTITAEEKELILASCDWMKRGDITDWDRFEKAYKAYKSKKKTK